MKKLKFLQKFGWLPALLLTTHLSHGQTLYGSTLNLDRYGCGEFIRSDRDPSINQYGVDICTGASGTARLSITNGGNVGIGTRTPEVKFQVYDADPAARNGVVSWLTRSGSGDVGLSFSQLGRNSYGIVLRAGGNGTAGGGIGLLPRPLAGRGRTAGHAHRRQRQPWHWHG